jgi:hypothetical protein
MLSPWPVHRTYALPVLTTTIDGPSGRRVLESQICECYKVGKRESGRLFQFVQSNLTGLTAPRVRTKL